jgi:hypothetical protein
MVKAAPAEGLHAQVAAYSRRKRSESAKNRMILAVSASRFSQVFEAEIPSRLSAAAPSSKAT